MSQHIALTLQRIKMQKTKIIVCRPSYVNVWWQQISICSSAIRLGAYLDIPHIKSDLSFFSWIYIYKYNIIYIIYIYKYIFIKNTHTNSYWQAPFILQKGSSFFIHSKWNFVNVLIVFMWKPAFCLYLFWMSFHYILLLQMPYHIVITGCLDSCFTQYD